MGWFQNAQHILGMNARNLEFVRPYNRASAVQRANNKLATKQCLVEHHLPTAKLYGKIADRKELFAFDWSALPQSFVLKPNFGLGGGGIVIVYGTDRSGQLIGNNNETYTITGLRRHVSNILDGNFSMSNIPDIAYFEERLKLSELFKHVSYQGVPDIRVIVFNSVPVMAMLRLPTKASGGKANLHIGGIGVGIDLVTGVTTYGISRDHNEITHHPDFNTPLRGITIPQWETILQISIDATKAVGLGYAGVDIVLDKQYGPVILEVNAHPGLEIQNANRLALRDRLERIAGLNITSTDKGLRVSKELFSEPSDVVHSNLPVLNVFESVVVQAPNKQSYALRARLDTGLASTTISKELALKFGFQDAIKALDTIVLPGIVAADRAQKVEESYRHAIKGLHPDILDIVAVRSGGQYIIRPKFPLTFTIGHKLITTQVAVALDNKISHPIIIGRRDLQGFLINPAHATL